MEPGPRDRVDEDGLRAGDRQVDATLCRLLAPHPHAVERLVRTALRQDRAPARGLWRARLALAAAALVILAVLLVPRLFVGRPESGDTTPAVAVSVPVRISISNDDGFVTISSSAGSKWILVSGDDS